VAFGFESREYLFFRSSISNFCAPPSFLLQRKMKMN
jgi:hypothetical protein